MLGYASHHVIMMNRIVMYNAHISTNVTHLKMMKGYGLTIDL